MFPKYQVYFQPATRNCVHIQITLENKFTAFTAFCSFLIFGYKDETGHHFYELKNEEDWKNDAEW